MLAGTDTLHTSVKIYGTRRKEFCFYVIYFFMVALEVFSLLSQREKCERKQQSSVQRRRGGREKEVKNDNGT